MFTSKCVDLCLQDNVVGVGEFITVKIYLYSQLVGRSVSQPVCQPVKSVSQLIGFFLINAYITLIDKNV